MWEHKTVYYYSEKGNETSFYEIIEYFNKTKNKYKTSFPLENSVYQYVTYFDDYLDAYDYLMEKKESN